MEFEAFADDSAILNIHGCDFTVKNDPEQRSHVHALLAIRSISGRDECIPVRYARREIFRRRVANLRRRREDEARRAGRSRLPA
jgi:hypothetical protein